MTQSPFIAFKTLALVLLLAVLAGCAKKQEAPMHELPGADQAAAAGRSRQLAYEHFVDIEAAPDRVAAIYDAGLAACRAATAAGCTLLESRVNSEPNASASLKFRARPDVVPALLSALGRKEGIARHSTQVEDLSGPITDTARQLAMLEDYRSRLEALRNRAGNDVDALIKVNRELAEVQSRLEAEDGKREVLARRVDNEILNVSIDSDRQQPFWAPIRRSLAEFGGNLAQGISIAIAGVAYLLPWLFLIAVVAWVVRRLWRWRRGRANVSGK
jgi:predicted small lipoprotein YifL